ncbi:MAG: VOC family protein [Armatimonadetes bacterium]|nr:VOC family protein [Armatimonadota bacterium]
MDNSLNKITFHHFGLALKDFSKAIEFYKKLGYDHTEPIIDSLQNVELVLCTSEKHPTVELVKPINNNSPITNYLSKNNEMIYHVCYEVEDIARDIKILFSNYRAFCVSKPKPAILFDNRLVSFYYINNVGLIEVLQK